MRYTFNLICCLLLQTIGFSASAVTLNENDSLQLKSAIWHQVDLAKPTQGELPITMLILPSLRCTVRMAVQ
ncbi:hypothetical protein [Pseudoalteromonas tetraodonis]|jgi:hypothetical protein|uniref:hypothetical protein n=1 Tax=Pseudoalteromonas tetraodonis TaxID=43659 RepID=UPI003D07A429